MEQKNDTQKSQYIKKNNKEYKKENNKEYKQGNNKDYEKENKMSNSCVNSIYILKKRPYTLWFIYIFIISLIFPLLNPIVFIISCYVFFGWYICLLYDYYILKNKPFYLLYSCFEGYNKYLIHFIDIFSHIIIPIICFYRCNQKVNLIHIILAWIYSRTWSFTQSNYKCLYYFSKNCDIYHCGESIFLCSYICEHLVLLIFLFYVIL